MSAPSNTRSNLFQYYGELIGMKFFEQSYDDFIIFQTIIKKRSWRRKPLPFSKTASNLNLYIAFQFVWFGLVWLSRVNLYPKIYSLDKIYQNNLLPNEEKQAEGEKTNKPNWFKWNFNAHLIALMRYWLFGLVVFLCVSFSTNFIGFTGNDGQNCTII